MSETKSLTAPNRESEAQPAAGLAGALARPELICLLLAVVTLATFWPVKNCDFINYDDPEYVTSNFQVQQGLTWTGVAWALVTGCASNWHPLTWLSHMLDVELFGSEAAGPHVVNLLFHTANAVLLFLLLRGLTSAHWRSACVAGLFALHPLHVESVAWISERKDVLSTLFWLLTLWAYARYATAPAVRNSKSKVIYGLALAFFALGLMSKPMLVTLPFVLLLLDYWPLNRFPGAKSPFPETKPHATESSTPDFRPSTVCGLVVEKIPFFVLSAISCAVTFWVQRTAKAVQPLANLPLGARIENAFVSYARYLGKVFWPAKLAVPYPHPGLWPWAWVVLAAALVAGLSLAALWLRRKLPFAVTGWFWFLGTLIPVIGLVQVGGQSLADRYTYVPLIGLFIVVVWGAGAAFARWRISPVTAGVAGVLVLGACAARTVDQLRYWRNSETLFRRAIALTKKNYLAYDNLGFYLFNQGHVDEAIDHYHQALQINPNDPNTLNNLGSALFNRQQYVEAIQCYEAALRLKPDYPDAHNNLGVALHQTGRDDEAVKHYTEALRLAPDDPQAHNNLANILVARGQVDAAISHYRQALRINPDFVPALNNLGWCLAAKAQYAEAAVCYERLLQINPNSAAGHCSLGHVLAAQQKWTEAAAQYTEALRVTPDFADAHLGLGRVLARSGRREEAIAHLTEALRLDPNNPDARQLLQTLGAPVPP